MAPLEMEQVATISHSAQTQCNTPVASGQTLPAGFPSVLGSPMSWLGSQYADASSYAVLLSSEDLAELQNALLQFKSLELDGDLVDRTNFPLPTLSKKLKAMQHEVYNGRGFALLRGLDVNQYSVDDLTIIYLGIQCYIGNRFGRQDKKGNMIVHIVADNSSPINANHHRHSTAPIAVADKNKTFHNEESGDVISWLTRSTAASGGKCIIASAHTIYNILAATRPDLIRVLARSDWPFALPKFHCRPVLQHHEGRMMLNFGRAALLGSASHPRPATLPALSALQVEALDAIEAVARATQLEMTTAAGDVHFVNNFAVLHRREGFVDGPAAREKRHLVRMRLRDDDLGWAVPDALRDEWAQAFGDAGAKVWHVEPMPEGFFPLRLQAN
ncbi:TfdA family oxidoreductase [Cordyceps militaris CM01]|uniref:TfdA family oxidoreductase n=1 Tax=Cordyceps militaris (strain CM01) TaxID=983644 RepID=G3JJK8_CORMM|nr:TfdA family oxidoreductase [Cordyceps militaris CM01]EGX92096.1 TfdA family oxidoreductase [Cordyceps militaris CM01]